ncbi:MFS transporter [Chloroflexota bacterium]
MLQHFALGAILTHVMPYLSSIGIARSVSSLVALAIPVASIFGRLSSGWLRDRLGSRLLFTASFASMTAGLLLFGYVTIERMWLLVPFIITFSLGWGTNATTRITLLREYFGRERFGTILGFIMGITMLGHVSGAPLAGWVFDTWGSYQGAWLGSCALTIAALVIMATTPPTGKTIQPVDQSRP